MPTTQAVLEQTLSNMIQPTSSSAVNNSLSLLQDLKSPVNMMTSSMSSNLNLSNINMANLNMNLQQSLTPHLHPSIHNALDNLINTTSAITNLQNTHNMTIPQQHSNGFGNVRRDNSPPNMLNNNGVSGINMGMGIGGMTMGSIFDPLPIVQMPVHIPQLPIKKEEKPLSMSQPQIPQKTMDGECSLPR